MVYPNPGENRGRICHFNVLSRGDRPAVLRLGAFAKFAIVSGWSARIKAVRRLGNPDVFFSGRLASSAVRAARSGEIHRSRPPGSRFPCSFAHSARSIRAFRAFGSVRVGCLAGASAEQGAPAHRAAPQAARRARPVDVPGQNLRPGNRTGHREFYVPRYLIAASGSSQEGSGTDLAGIR